MWLMGSTSAAALVVVTIGCEFARAQFRGCELALPQRSPPYDEARHRTWLPEWDRNRT